MPIMVHDDWIWPDDSHYDWIWLDDSHKSAILSLNPISVMTFTLPAEEDSILRGLVAMGRYASREAVLADAVRRMENEHQLSVLIPEPLSEEEENQVYAADEQWESVERPLAGQAVPEI